jgi:hypothetical protein
VAGTGCLKSLKIPFRDLSRDGSLLPWRSATAEGTLFFGRNKYPPGCYSVKNRFFIKDALNTRKNGQIGGSIGVIMHIRISENVKK